MSVLLRPPVQSALVATQLAIQNLGPVGQSGAQANFGKASQCSHTERGDTP